LAAWTGSLSVVVVWGLGSAWVCRATAVGRGMATLRRVFLVFVTCESGSGALLGAQDNSVLLLLGVGLRTGCVRAGWWEVRDAIRVVCLTRVGSISVRDGFGRAWTRCRVQGRVSVCVCVV
jgi:hypothetical protein